MNLVYLIENMIVQIPYDCEFNKIKENLKNPKKGDTYIWYRNQKPIKLVVCSVKNKNFSYFIDGKKFKIPINELEDLINSIYTESFKFFNYYEHQNFIEKQKLENNKYEHN